MATWGSLKRNESISEALFGKGQGYFRYWNSSGNYETIIAVGGRLLRDGGVLPIEGLPDGFQKDRMIEAVQWKDKMFIATGTKLVEYDGLSAKVVEAYKPKPLEALYVGTNGLAAFPDTWMEFGEHDNLRVDGVFPSLRKGVSGQTTKFSAFISRPNPDKVIEYKWEYKLANREGLVLGKDWTAGASEWSFTPNEIGNYTIQVSIREKVEPGQTAPEKPPSGQIPSYTVTAFNENETIDTSQMHTCNRILLHWDRLIVYGDSKNKTTVYISHLQNPRYFPTNNTIDFENSEQEPLNILVKYRDFLVAFLPSSIQALYGKGPIGDDTYRRVVLHTSLGCIAPESAKVMGNYITFLSKQGIHILKSIGMVEEKMNVEKIDSSIENMVTPDHNACAIVYDNQYMLCYPDRRMRFRFYYEIGVWTKDESPRLDFSRMYEWNGDLVGISSGTGQVYMFKDDTYTDAGFIYEDRVLTKSFDFGEPHNPKKMKELQLIMARYKKDTNLSVNVNVDDNPVVNTTSTEYHIVNNEINWAEVDRPNINIDPGTVFGEWLMGESSFDSAKQYKAIVPMAGKGLVASVDIRHKEDGPNALLSLGFIFKTKKP
ncbi:MAG: hypothetical protein ACI33P_06615 [Lysinibacillus sp.]